MNLLDRIKVGIRLLILGWKIKYGYKYFLRRKYPIITDKAIEVTINRHAELLTEILGIRVSVNKYVLRSVMRMNEKFGLPYCPCRLERTLDTICPCKYHVKEIIKYGRCRCGLFFIK